MNEVPTRIRDLAPVSPHARAWLIMLDANPGYSYVRMLENIVIDTARHYSALQRALGVPLADNIPCEVKP